MSSSSLAFFASAAASFQPAPYTPAVASGSRPTFSTRNSSHRGHDSLAIPPAGMDPQQSDPNVLFVHPPFTTFPNSHLHPDGLTYSLMAENPEWFLDAADFVSQNNSNTQAISYPPHLEPPRGWCPAKKKDLKERGDGGWPEGEEPRLRCTFCRRTYAGVNAKSMWRRHVFEKHKIAMSNRRDGNSDRPRGRGSGSKFSPCCVARRDLMKISEENKHVSSGRNRDDAHDSLVSIVVAPQTAPESVSHKSRFRSGKLVEVPRRKDRESKKNSRQDSLPLTPRPSQKSLPEPSDDDDSDIEPPTKPATPPLTPHAEISSDPPVISENSDALVTTSPAIPHPAIPESPYNPLQTPSFRHSPPRLPSDQPWRFPSPSHPLHSMTREISLTMLARPAASPVIKGLPMLGASPMLAQSSPISTAIHSESGPFETPARNFLFAKPRSRARFLDQISSPLSSIKFRSVRQRLQSSPLPWPSRGTPGSHRRQRSDVSEEWMSEDAASSSMSLESSSNDPFSLYSSWPSADTPSSISPVRLPRPTLEAESPVLRSGSMTSLIGLGLLEPFGYRTEVPFSEVMDDDLKDILLSPGAKRASRIEGKRPAALTTEAESVAEDSPPLKRRRMSAEITDT